MNLGDSLNPISINSIKVLHTIRIRFLFPCEYIYIYKEQYKHFYSGFMFISISFTEELIIDIKLCLIFLNSLL